MPASRTPTQTVTLSEMEEIFTCTDYRDAFLVVECPQSVNTSVPCAPGLEYRFSRNQTCREGVLKPMLSPPPAFLIALSVVLFVTFTIIGMYLSVDIERVGMEGKDRDELHKVVDDEFASRDGCKVPPKVFDPKRMAPPNHRTQDDWGLASTPVLHGSDYPEKVF